MLPNAISKNQNPFSTMRHIKSSEMLRYKQTTKSPQDNQLSRRNHLVIPRGVMVKAMNFGIVVREFVLQSRYYVHFRANTLGKGMNPLILPPAMGK